MSVVNVEYEDTNAAVLYVVADAGTAT